MAIIPVPTVGRAAYSAARGDGRDLLPQCNRRSNANVPRGVYIRFLSCDTLEGSRPINSVSSSPSGHRRGLNNPVSHNICHF